MSGILEPFRDIAGYVEPCRLSGSGNVEACSAIFSWSRVALKLELDRARANEVEPC